MLPKTISLIAVVALTFSAVAGQDDWESTICRVKYSGGGDWYSDPSSLPNLLKFLNNNTSVSVSSVEARVALDDDEVFGYPYLASTNLSAAR